MSDDFGTISARRGDRAKEIEVLRKHRESLVKMLEDVDAQLRELEIFETPAAARPLVTTPDYDDDSSAAAQPGSGARGLLILGAAALALALIAGLIWWASRDRSAATTVVEETATAQPAAEETETGDTAPATVAEEPAAAPPAAAAALIAEPASRDYGLVRKGTRVTRQFEITNTTDEPISISLARSACRCLYYEHAPVVPPKAKESVTVTVDGAKAKAGTLRETIRVSRRGGDASAGTSFDVIATVR